MAVMDFREGGFGFARLRGKSRDARRDFDFEAQDWDAYDSHDGDERRFMTDAAQADGLGARMARLTHYLGALLSVALMVGLLVWGWQLIMRDVSGVPVIQAMEGDARIAPDNPGGELADHTGLAVNSVSGGADIAPSPQVALAPETAALDDSDVPMGQLGATVREPQVVADLPFALDPAPQIAMTDAEAAAAAAEAARQQAAVEALISGATISDAPAEEGPVNEVVTDENGTRSDAIAAALAEAAAPSTKPVLSASARPAPRPRRVAAVAPAPAAAPVAANSAEAPAQRAAAAAPAPAPRPRTRIAAADTPAAVPATAPAPASSAKVASGAPLAQIGAFDSEAIAQSEWGRIAGKNGDLFASKSPVIVRHNANGRTFWRLRVAGFDSRADANRFCAALSAKGTACIPATAN